MAETGATAAGGAPPAEGKVIPIHSLDEWSMQIDEANSTDTKKLVFIDFFLMRFSFRCCEVAICWVGG
jgi:thioredoxin 1